MSDVRQRLRDQLQQADPGWLARVDAEVAATDDELESERRRNWLDAARAYDPAASLEEELVVRLVGGAAATGGLALMVGDALLKPLQEVVESASSTGDGEAPRLEVFGLSAGSTVLHMRAVEDAPDGMGDVPVDATRAAPAITRMLSAVRAAEAQEDLRQWAPMVDSVRHLAEALTKLDLSLGMEWRRLDGWSTAARLTAAGCNYLKSLEEGSTTSHPRTVTGRVSELRESGLIKLKTGTSRTSPVHVVDVAPDDLLGLRLALGDQVSVLVQEEIKADALGVVKSRTLRLTQVLSREGRLSPARVDGPPA